jgi:hypothetical protein
MTRAWIFTLVLGTTACREEVHELELVFGAGMAISDGLRCVVEDDQLLIAELFDQTPTGCMVIDVVPTDGQPGCRLSELIPWCKDHDCTPDTDYRVKIELGPLVEEIRAEGQMMGTSLLEALIGKLSGTVLFESAPDTIAVLRATVVGIPCADVSDEPRFACADVIGCMYSCPVALQSFEGQLVLDLDALSAEMCVRDVRLCAADRMFDRDMQEAPCDTNPLAP